MATSKLLCPYCGGGIRINTKYYAKVGGNTKQAGCQDDNCGAKGPMAETNELARHAFGVYEGDVNWP